DVDVPVTAEAAVAVAERFNRALSSGDLATVEALLAADVLILESGGAERSREEYMGHHAVSDAAFLKGAHRQLLRQRARAAGEFAWVGTESELHAQKDGQPLTVQSDETMVLKETADGWRIVHIHWSSRTKR
ncbi:MAG: nuclear transport factor 2 family protein, partial [bacterium]